MSLIDTPLSGTSALSRAKSKIVYLHMVRVTSLLNDCKYRNIFSKFKKHIAPPYMLNELQLATLLDVKGLKKIRKG